MRKDEWTATRAVVPIMDERHQVLLRTEQPRSNMKRRSSSEGKSPVVKQVLAKKHGGKDDCRTFATPEIQQSGGGKGLTRDVADGFPTLKEQGTRHMDPLEVS